MKSFRYLTIAVLSLMTAACSSDIDSEQPSESHQGKGIPFTATINMKGSATRSAMTESTSTISAVWETGDELALVYEVSGQKQVTKATMTVRDDKSATITATIAEGVTDGTSVKLLYPYDAVNSEDPGDAAYGTIKEDALDGQDGTLETIAEKYDLCQGDGIFAVSSEGTASLKADVTMESQIAIWKLTLTDGTNALKTQQLLVYQDGDPENMLVNALLSEASNVFYVAVPAVSNVEIDIQAPVDDNTYIYSKKGVTLEAGKYYQSTVTMEVVVTYRVYTAKDTYTDETVPSTATTLTGAVTPGNLAAGTYVVSGTATCDGNLTLTGDVNLILKDGASLTVNGSIKGGVDEEGNPNYAYSLSIYGQEQGTGELTIGVGDIVGKNLTIHGGIITITNGEQGIETGGTFTIYDGTVNTTGSSYGIRAYGTMSVYGGKITATSTDIEAEGILADGTITISGGVVTAKGGAYGIGMKGTTIISGGTVTAIGGDGNGSEENESGGDGYNGNLTVTGGTFTATGGAANGPGENGSGISGTIALGDGINLYIGTKSEPDPSSADPSYTGPQEGLATIESRYVVIK